MKEEEKRAWYRPMEDTGEETLDLFEEAGLYDLPDREELLREYADRREQPAGKQRRWTRLLWAVPILALVALIIATAVYFSREPEESAQLPPDAFQYFYDALETDVITGENDIPRADPDPAVTLTLQPYGGEAELELQELYVRCVPSVVGIMGQRSGRDYSWGTGIVMTEDGYVLTNTHVLDGSDGVKVSLHDGTVYDARLVGADPESDVAVLKINATGLTAAVFADSDGASVGDRVVAIGNPLSGTFSGTMTDGILSGLSRSVTYGGRTSTLLQTNAALNEGNSGGPLFNRFGQVIGITNMKMMTTGTATVEGIGFAIPTTTVQSVADQLLAEGHMKDRPVLGIYVYETAAEEDHPGGLLVDSVEPASDAAKKGLRSGDIITALDGQPITDFDVVQDALNTMEIGQTVTLTLWREGQVLEITIALMSRNELYGG